MIEQTVIVPLKYDHRMIDIRWVDRGFLVSLKGERRKWSLDQLSYVPKIVVEYDNGQSHYSIFFQSERDAILFKMFWS